MAMIHLNSFCLVLMRVLDVYSIQHTDLKITGFETGFVEKKHK